MNLEVDVLGKYVERSLSSVLDRLGALEDWQSVSYLSNIGQQRPYSIVIPAVMVIIEIDWRCSPRDDGHISSHTQPVELPSWARHDLRSKSSGNEERSPIRPHVVEQSI